CRRRGARGGDARSAEGRGAHGPSSGERAHDGPGGGGVTSGLASTGVTSAGRHYLRRDGRSILPVGAHFVPVQGPDWPWRVDAGAFDAAFGQMAAAGLDAVRIDLLWSAVE